MAQLLIRPSLNDHQVIADLLAPPPMPTIRRSRPPIAQLVADAHIAVQRLMTEPVRPSTPASVAA